MIIHQLPKIFPSTVLYEKHKDYIDNVSIFHTERMDGAWSANTRIMDQVGYWMEYNGI